jgi:hypothetical protein
MTNTVPNSLIEYIKSDLSVVWCGAGLSVISGFPTWDELILHLVEDCADNGLLKDDLDELNALQDSGYRNDVADFCRDFLGEAQYRVLLHKLFSGMPVSSSSDIHEKLLDIKFSAILTTNYDKLIELAYTKRHSVMPPVYTNRDTQSLWQRLARNDFFILKIHGDIERPETIVLSSNDYTEHVFGNLSFIQFFHRLLTAKSVFFIGTSFNEPYILRLLEETRFLTAGVGLQHFALLPYAGRIRSRLLRDRYNVSIITYDPVKCGGHTAVIKNVFDEIKHRSL